MRSGLGDLNMKKQTNEVPSFIDKLLYFLMMKSHRIKLRSNWVHSDPLEYTGFVRVQISSHFLLLKSSY